MKGNDISIQNNLVHKEHVENDTEDSAVRITHLKEEKVERDTWAIEKNISTLEFSDESLLLKRLDQEKMQAQCLAAELSSEVQFLKSSSVVAQEKLHSLQVVHREEVNMLKHVHDWELEAKEKHIATERSFLLEQGAIRETLTQLMGKAKDWSIKVEALQEALAIERELSNNDRIKWLDILKSSVNEQQVCLHEWGKKSSETLFQVQKLIDLIGSEIKNVKEIHIKENDRMEKECTQIQSLQKALHSERAQFLEDLSTSRAKLEEIHEKCFQEKEACLGKCFEERKELLAEKEAVLKMKEQLYHADAALEKKSMEHLSLMQNVFNQQKYNN
ncbi:hypothetical protein O6H91_22G005300 [Diphasiastrum complanatum]|nr:hypothetical protein O6H91_22G005300 [Diphasiastrum complanatum]